MAAENDTTAALGSIRELRCALDLTPAASASTVSLLPLRPLHAPTTQCADLETELMSSVAILKGRNWIFGSLPMIAELINPSEEQENEDNLQVLDDDKIVAQVHYKKALEQEEIQEVEVESEDEEDDDAPPQVTTIEALEMCRTLGSFCLGTGVVLSLQTGLNVQCGRGC